MTEYGNKARETGWYKSEFYRKPMPVISYQHAGSTACNLTRHQTNLAGLRVCFVASL